VSWRRCPAAVVVEDESFLCFDGSALYLALDILALGSFVLALDT